MGLAHCCCRLGRLGCGSPEEANEPKAGPQEAAPGEGTTPLVQVQKCDLGLRRAQALEG